MMHKLKIALISFILLCIAAVMLITASLSFGVPFNIQPLRFETIHLFTTDMNENSSNAYMSVKWKNLSFIKDIDYVELTIKGLDEGGSNSVKIRTADGICVKPFKSNQKTIYKLPFDTDSTDYAVNVDVISYADGSQWRNESEGNTLELSMNKETDSGTFPAKIREAMAWHNQPDELQYDLSWDSTDEDSGIIALVVRARCYDENGNILSDEEGNNTFYSGITDAFEGDAELNALYPGETESTGLFMGAVTNAVDTVRIGLVKAVDTDGNVYCSDGEPEILLETTGKKGFPFEEKTDNQSLNAFISRMESNFREEGLDYNKPVVYQNESFALMRYPDLDVRVEMDASGSVRSGEVSCCKYMDFSDEKEYAVIGKAQIAIMIASMENAEYSDDLREQLKDLFIGGMPGYVYADRVYSYLQGYKYYLKDGETGIMTCAMGDEIDYIAPEFFSGME